jgi:hypothetical protein
VEEITVAAMQAEGIIVITTTGTLKKDIDTSRLLMKTYF